MCLPVCTLASHSHSPFLPKSEHISSLFYRSTQTEKQYLLRELGPLSSGRVHGPCSNKSLPQDAVHCWERCQDILDTSVSQASSCPRLFIVETESRAGKSQSCVTPLTDHKCLPSASRLADFRDVSPRSHSLPDLTRTRTQ